MNRPIAAVPTDVVSVVGPALLLTMTAVALVQLGVVVRRQLLALPD